MMKTENIIALCCLSLIFVACLIILILGLTGVLVPKSVLVTPQCLFAPFYVIEFLSVEINGISDKNVLAATNETQLITFVQSGENYYIPSTRYDCTSFSSIPKIRSFSQVIGVLTQSNQISFFSSESPTTEFSYTDDIIDFQFLNDSMIVFITSTGLFSASLINTLWTSSSIKEDSFTCLSANNNNVIVAGTNEKFYQFVFNNIIFNLTQTVDQSCVVIYIDDDDHVFLSSSSNSFLYIGGLLILQIEGTYKQFASMNSNFVLALNDSSLQTLFLNNYSYASQWSSVSTTSPTFYFSQEQRLLGLIENNGFALRTTHCLTN